MESRRSIEHPDGDDGAGHRHGVGNDIYCSSRGAIDGLLINTVPKEEIVEPPTDLRVFEPAKEKYGNSTYRTYWHCFLRCLVWVATHLTARGPPS